MRRSPFNRPGRRAGRGLIALLVFAFGLLVGRATEPSAAEAVARLDTTKKTIGAEVSARLATNRLAGSYTTAWRPFEDAAIDALCAILPRHVAGLSQTNFDRGQPGREKNRPADLAVLCPDGTIEISIKSARASANPENDLGTFRDHPHRKRLFAASFTLWVRYDDTGGVLRCDRVFFDRSWRFVGKSSLVDGVKYRKKDGNMRPKPWAMFDSDETFWPSETEFEAAVKRAELHRAQELIREYLRTLSDSDQRLLYEELRRKFDHPAPPPAG